ncbi:unnamed protein product [Choristocarpus tenellus]
MCKRSSKLPRSPITTVKETEDEIFHETLYFDLLALGGGVASGYWAQAISKDLSEKGLTAGIISGDCDGLAPYERPALSKGCLVPGLEKLLDYTATPSDFPFVCKGSGGTEQTPHWYKEHGITLLCSSQAIWADLDKKFLIVKRICPDGKGGLLSKQTTKVGYKYLMIATGVRPRRIEDSANGNLAYRIQESCFCSRHPDLLGSPPVLFKSDEYGFGSVHYLRDLGDSIKLLQAMGRVEADGQETCRDAVVVIGGGLIACEVASAIVSHYPDIPLTLVIPRENLLQGLGFGKEIGYFYEKQLSRAGVKFAKSYCVTRLWALDEEGKFPTLERVPQAPLLKKTLPRSFGPADPNLTSCRGVVLSGAQSEEQVWLPARYIVLGIGSIPNTDLFHSSLSTAPDGSLITDSALRVSHASRDVFAAGDVASVPLLLAGGRLTRFEHVHAAREMALHCARVMLYPEGQESKLPYNPVPSFYSRFLDLSWKFYGFTEGEMVVLGMEAFPTSRTFGAFWLKEGQIVGAFLEEDTSLGVDHSAALELMARERPRVLDVKHLSKCPLDQLIADPHCLSPPELGVGEFHADTDESSIVDAFRKYAVAGNKVKASDLDQVMKVLGADWDKEEFAEVLRSLDPCGSGMVHFDAFKEWWSH